MANIVAILPGVSLADCYDMTLAELGEWHERARAWYERTRAPK